MSTAESIRAALASFAADAPDNAFPSPAHIRNYPTLRALVNQHGGSLLATEASMGMRFGSYTTDDTDHDGIPDTYVLILHVLHTSHQVQLTLTPMGVDRGAIESRP